MTERKDVVTLYFCGSGNNRDQGNKNTIPRLYDTTKGERRIIFDGPGGAAIKKTEAITKALAGGDISTGWAVTAKGKAANQAKTWEKMLAAQHGTKTTALTGTGTQSNIVMALQWLWLEYYKHPFADVNVAGFSRGGVSAIMLGHAMQAAGFADLASVRVNIFTFDPVPGGLNDFKDKGNFAATGRAGTPKTLAPIVANYRSILQESLKTWIGGIVPKDRTFKCVVPDYIGSNPARTPRELFPMPGDHGASASYTNDKGPGAIGAHLCQSFLMAHGTDFTSNFVLSPSELLEAYATTRLSHTKGGKAFGEKQAASKHRVNLVANPFRRHPFYVNAQHATLMAMHYPSVAKAIDGDGTVEGAARAQLAGTLPTTFSALVNLGVI